MRQPRLPDVVRCEACGTPIGMFKGGRLKIHVRSRLVAVRKSGEVELTCHHCKRATDLPLRYAFATDER
jgi:hypothetical protein